MASDTHQFRLNDQQVQHFENEGYLVIDRLFSDAELQIVILTELSLQYAPLPLLDVAYVYIQNDSSRF